MVSLTQRIARLERNFDEEKKSKDAQVKRNKNVVAGMEQGKKCMGKTKKILKTNDVGGEGQT